MAVLYLGQLSFAGKARRSIVVVFVVVVVIVVVVGIVVVVIYLGQLSFTGKARCCLHVVLTPRVWRLGAAAETALGLARDRPAPPSRMRLVSSTAAEALGSGRGLLRRPPAPAADPSICVSRLTRRTPADSTVSPQGEDDAVFNDKKALTLAAKLLSCEPQQLENAICTQNIKAWPAG